ncbi:MAG: PTS sugar transporter subunit IIA [Candidatus Cloacimonetes bacterium]|nr:PTS sugar transporter subunit IIA [Candidatus Cloacimonadota bacterium]MBS3766844.1 PTS sugar transporter subunit IIA [Candidatus Cloacimonadota bacterium]
MEKDQILTLKEAAELLKVSQETVINLVSQDEIGGKKIGNQWRFDRQELKKWKSSQKKKNVEQDALDNVVKRFFQYINKDHIITDLKAIHRFDVLAKMSKFAKDLKICRNQSWLFNMLHSREKLLSTGVGNGIAFLHPRKIHSRKIKESGVMLGICKSGIEFRSIDKMPVSLFFLILMKSEKEHLFVLSYLSQLFRNNSLRDKIINAPDKKTILELLKLKYNQTITQTQE